MSYRAVPADPGCGEASPVMSYSQKSPVLHTGTSSDARAGVASTGAAKTVASRHTRKMERNRLSIPGLPRHAMGRAFKNLSPTPAHLEVPRFDRGFMARPPVGVAGRPW